jgi:oxalate decarboxylase
MESGGWARQITVRELGISKNIAGVNMRLNAGGIRELHWPKAAEWSYMLSGTARITAIDAEGNNFVDDVGVGDLWYFPSGMPHSIQGLGQDGCEFLLVFDDGEFDEDNTFLLSDWLKHVPSSVLAKNFGVSDTAFANSPDPSQLYIFAAGVPGPLASDTIAGASPVPHRFSHRLMAQQPVKTKGGSVRIADSTVFPISKTIAAGLVEVLPGGFANCIGIPTRMSGIILSKARPEWVYLRVQVRPEPSILKPAMSVTFLSQWGIMSRISVTRRCVFWRDSRAATMPTSR